MGVALGARVESRAVAAHIPAEEALRANVLPQSCHRSARGHRNALSKVLAHLYGIIGTQCKWYSSFYLDSVLSYFFALPDLICLSIKRKTYHRTDKQHIDKTAIDNYPTSGSGAF